MKKKFCCILLVLAFLCIAPAQALADPSASTAAGLLTIDNKNVYPGMDKSYGNGYIPSVSNGTATVVLPLIQTGTGPAAITNNKINVTVGLGDSSTSPFVFKNYDKSISLSTAPIKAGSQLYYLVKLSLPMVDNRTMGRYPVTITVNYTTDDADKTAYTQTFTVYVTVTDGKDPNATPTPEPTPTPVPTEAPMPQPKITIQSHTIAPEPVMAGSTFDLNVRFLNTSESQSVQNITVTAKGDTADLIPVEDTGSAYIKRIGSGVTADYHAKIQVRQDAKAGAQKVLLTLDYENSKAAPFTQNYEIIVQVNQPIRLEYDKPSIPQTVNAGDTISIALNLMNMGKSTLYNVRCTLSAPGLIPEGSAYLGNMESGTSKSGDINVFVGSLDMASDSGQTALPSEEVSGDAPVVKEGDVAPAADSAVAQKRAAAAVAGPAIAVAVPEGAAASSAPAEEGGKPGMDVPDAGSGNYGPTQGKITISYEDQDGKQYSTDIDISTTIGPPVIQPLNPENPEDVKAPETVSQWWISVIIAGGVAAALIVFLRIRRKKKLAAEDDHEDE